MQAQPPVSRPHGTFEESDRAIERGPGGLQLFRPGDPFDQRSRSAKTLRNLPILVPNAQKADPELRISLLTCVGTAGFEPATP